MNRVDITGQRFGRLTALSRQTRRKRDGAAFSAWLCSCDCGKQLEVPLSCLRTSNTTSCGCLRYPEGVIYGKARHVPGYNTWHQLKARCRDPKHPYYPSYGGRGITVCDRWMVFENFYADMGPRPTGMSIERVNNDGPYSPENCVWATNKEQARNKRSNITITIEGKRRCLKAWCEELGVSYHAARYRIRTGQPPLVALRLKEPR